MMRVRVFGTLRQFVGAKEIDLDLAPGDTIHHLVAKISVAYPVLENKIVDGEGKLQGSINILVNGRNIRFLDDLDSVLQAGDELALFPAVGGG